MSWSAVGSFISQINVSSFSLTPNGVGNLIMLEIEQSTSDTETVASVSSTNVTWLLVSGPLAATSGGTGNVSLYQGKVTSTSTATVTITWSGGTPTTIDISGHEFSSTVGSWAVDTTGSLNVTTGVNTNTSSALTPAGAGELYFGYTFDTGTAVAGTTSGYSWNVDTAGNGCLFNANCTSSAQNPTWGESGHVFGLSALIKETPTAAGVLTSPTASRVEVPKPFNLISPARNFIPQHPASIAKAPKTYYVSNSGNNSNNGLSPATAFQTIGKVNSLTLNPGDTVLFNGGNTFNDTILTPVGLGAIGAPITIGSYGTGNATLSFGTNDAIYIQSEGGYIIQNLNITGISGSTSFSGIQFYATGSGQLPPITIQNCVVTGWQNGISVGGNAATDGYIGINIINCTTNNNINNGILVYGTTFSAGSPSYNHKNLLIQNCTANNNVGNAATTGSATGYGMAIGGINGGTITGCTTANNCSSNGDVSNGPVGLMVYASTGVTISNCLSYNNVSGTTSDGDGIDLDIDTNNCIVEYCLSYGNSGAGILLWGGTADSYWGSVGANIVRYNVCWGNGVKNSSNSNFYGEITLGGNVSNAQVYNNTCYARVTGSNQGSAFNVPTSNTLASCTVRNNIFYSASTANGVVNVVKNYTTGQLFLQGNLYYQVGTFDIIWGSSTYNSLSAFRAATGQETLSGNNVGYQTDPLMPAISATPTITTASALASATQYNPVANSSPVIGTGINLISQFSLNIGGLDYYGNTLIAPFNIGASQGVALPLGSSFTPGLAVPGKEIPGLAQLALSSPVLPNDNFVPGIAQVGLANPGNPGNNPIIEPVTTQEPTPIIRPFDRVRKFIRTVPTNIPIHPIGGPINFPGLVSQVNVVAQLGSVNITSNVQPQFGIRINKPYPLSVLKQATFVPQNNANIPITYIAVPSAQVNVIAPIGFVNITSNVQPQFSTRVNKPYPLNVLGQATFVPQNNPNRPNLYFGVSTAQVSVVANFGTVKITSANNQANVNVVAPNGSLFIFSPKPVPAPFPLSSPYPVNLFRSRLTPQHPANYPNVYINGITANVNVVAPFGSIARSITAPTANVNVAVYFGTILKPIIVQPQFGIRVNKPYPLWVLKQATIVPQNNPNKPNTYINGTTATVNVVANFGSTKVTPSEITANVNVVANFGTINIFEGEPPAIVNVQAGLGFAQTKNWPSLQQFPMRNTTPYPLNIVSRLQPQYPSRPQPVFPFNGTTSNVNVVANLGQVFISTRFQAPAPFNKSVPVPLNIIGHLRPQNPASIPRVYVNGLRANVTVAGGAPGSMITPGPAQVNVVAVNGSKTISVSESTANVNVAAVTGSEKITLTSNVGHVNVASVVNARVSVSGITAQVNSSALFGAIKEFVTVNPAGVTVRANPQGTAGGAPTARVSVQAQMGSFEIDVLVQPANVNVQSVVGISGGSSAQGHLMNRVRTGSILNSSKAGFARPVRGRIYNNTDND